MLQETQVYAYVPNFVSIGLFCHTRVVEKPIFCRFLDFSILRCRHLAAYGESWMRMHNYKFPLSNGIKTVSILHRLQSEVVRTFSVVRKHDAQTHTNKKLNVFGRVGGGWNPSLTKLGTMIEDLEHVLAPPKHFTWKIWRETDILNLTAPPYLRKLERFHPNFNS